jgi:hypothetical protein
MSKDDQTHKNRAGVSRRGFMAGSAAIGAAAAGMSAAPQKALAQSGPVRTGASGFAPLEVNSPMARWKLPQPVDWVNGAHSRFSFPNWQSGNDDSVYYNLNIPEFFPTRVVRPDEEFSVLERDIQADLLNLTFTDHEGNTTQTLSEYLVGRRQVQAMLMAHQGKIVFEVYPGMNPLDMHVWMSASKTTAGLLVSMLADEGAVDLDQPLSSYVEELQGSAWDDITVKNTMNMATALNNEETFENLVNPDSWIANWFSAVFGVGDVTPTQWREMMASVEKLDSEGPGELFRYSTANTQALVMLTEAVTGLPWQAFWHERVWSKIGARNPLIVGLTPDGMPVGGGADQHHGRGHDPLRLALHAKLERGLNRERGAAADAGPDLRHGRSGRLHRLDRAHLRDPMVRRSALQEHRTVGPRLRRRCDVQARQYGPGHLCRSRPRFLRDDVCACQQRHLRCGHRPFARLSARRGEGHRRGLKNLSRGPLKRAAFSPRRQTCQTRSH